MKPFKDTILMHYLAVDLKSVVQRSKAVRSLLRENNLSQLALQCSLEVRTYTVHMH